MKTRLVSMVVASLLVVALPGAVLAAKSSASGSITATIAVSASTPPASAPPIAFDVTQSGATGQQAQQLYVTVSVYGSTGDAFYVTSLPVSWTDNHRTVGTATITRQNGWSYPGVRLTAYVYVHSTGEHVSPTIDVPLT